MNPLLATTSLPPPNPADDPAVPPAADAPTHPQAAEGPPDPPDTDAPAGPPAAGASADPRAARPPPPLPHFLTYARLRPIVPYTRQHLGRLERAGRFPRRVRLGPGRVAWAEDEVRAWLEDRKAERGGRAR